MPTKTDIQNRMSLHALQETESTLKNCRASLTGGAQSSAVIFSLIETARENGLDPYRYLSWLLNEAPGRATSDPDWAAALLPQNAPPLCRADST